MATASHFERARAVWDIAEVAKTPDGKALLHRHLTQVMEGAAFRGSHRSAQFLEYVVQQSAKGHGDQLKERLIGMELFGRLPSYDTGEDAIVRVTASDVRKRLAQHYSRAGTDVDLQISLRPGKYVPELVRNDAQEGVISAPILPAQAQLGHPAEAPAVPGPTQPEQTSREEMVKRAWYLAALGGLALVIGLALTVTHWRRPAPPAQARANNVVSAPWDVLFDGSRPVLLVASDPNIEEIYGISHEAITLSDYANGIYLPHDISRFSSDQVHFMKNVLRGNKIADVDGEIIVGFASLMRMGAPRIAVEAARAVRIQELEKNQNFIFLGSPRTNPWTTIYDPLLDFQFGYDPGTGAEFFRNHHPVNGEKSEYVATARGYQTGDSFATVTILQRGSHGERVLIIAGTNGEGTQAAGDLVADPQRWEQALRPCHLPNPSSKHSLQLLLQLGSMAGSANDVKVVACHLLNVAS